jgi:hypothetical protein
VFGRAIEGLVARAGEALTPTTSGAVPPSCQRPPRAAPFAGIEDPEFDLDWHIRHRVPAPGGPRELVELRHLVALPLDRSRPLWEMWVIEGLEHGHVAVLSKVHHAAIDGASGNEIIVATLDLEPNPPPTPPPDEPWQPDRVPTDVELLSYAASSLARQPFRVASHHPHGAIDHDRQRLPPRGPPPRRCSAPLHLHQHRHHRPPQLRHGTLSLPK